MHRLNVKPFSETLRDVLSACSAWGVVMPAKRKVSQANVASKGRRVTAEVAALTDLKKQQEFQEKLDKLVELAKAQPSKIDLLITVLESEDQTHDPSLEMCPSLAGKKLSATPPKILMKFFEQLFGWSRGHINSLCRQDGKVLTKLMTRLALVGPNQGIGPLNIEHWTSLWSQRIRAMHPDLASAIVISGTYKVDWNKGGVYKLIPELDDSADTDAAFAHKYTHVSFLGKTLELPLGIRGTHTHSRTIGTSHWLGCVTRSSPPQRQVFRFSLTSQAICPSASATSTSPRLTARLL